MENCCGMREGYVLILLSDISEYHTASTVTSLISTSDRLIVRWCELAVISFLLYERGSCGDQYYYVISDPKPLTS